MWYKGLCIYLKPKRSQILTSLLLWREGFFHFIGQVDHPLKIFQVTFPCESEKKCSTYWDRDMSNSLFHLLLPYGSSERCLSKIIHILNKLSCKRKMSVLMWQRSKVLFWSAAMWTNKFIMLNRYSFQYWYFPELLKYTKTENNSPFKILK